MITKRDFVLRGSCFCEKYKKLFSDETVGYLVPTNKKRCFSGSGRLLYNLCMDGCQYVVDDNVQITLPDSLFDVNLIPAGENVFFNLSLSLSLFISVSISLSLYLSLSLALYLSVSLYLCFHFIIPLSFSLSLCLCLSLLIQKSPRCRIRVCRDGIRGNLVMENKSTLVMHPILILLLLICVFVKVSSLN